MNPLQNKMKFPQLSTEAVGTNNGEVAETTLKTGFQDDFIL